MTRSLFFAVVTSLLLLAVLGGGATVHAGWGDKRYKFDDSFEADLDGIEIINLTIKNGSIQVETVEGTGRIEIDMKEDVRKSSRDDAEKLAGQVKMEGERAGNRLFLELDYGDLRKKDRDRYSCSVEIRLPSDVELHLETTNGSIRVAEMGKDIVATTTNGSIEIAGCKGEARLRTTNGSVKVGKVEKGLDAYTTNGNIRIAGVGGDVIGRTTNGSITFHVESESNFRIEASTTNGKVKDSLSGGVFTATYNKRHTKMEGVYGSAKHKVSLETTNGSVKLVDA